MRTIREEEHYKKQIEALRVDWKRLDEALSQVHTALAAIPESFPVVPGTTLRRLKIVGYPDVPPLSIFFTYTDTEVHIKAAELIEQE